MTSSTTVSGQIPKSDLTILYEELVLKKFIVTRPNSRYFNHSIRIQLYPGRLLRRRRLEGPQFRIARIVPAHIPRIAAIFEELKKDNISFIRRGGFLLTNDVRMVYRLMQEPPEDLDFDIDISSDEYIASLSKMDTIADTVKLVSREPKFRYHITLKYKSYDDDVIKDFYVGVSGYGNDVEYKKPSTGRYLYRYLPTSIKVKSADIVLLLKLSFGDMISRVVEHIKEDDTTDTVESDNE